VRPFRYSDSLRAGFRESDQRAGRNRDGLLHRPGTPPACHAFSSHAEQPAAANGYGSAAGLQEPNRMGDGRDHPGAARSTGRDYTPFRVRQKGDTCRAGERNPDAEPRTDIDVNRYRDQSGIDRSGSRACDPDPGHPTADCHPVERYTSRHPNRFADPNGNSYGHAVTH
jgi:hypothetical protein